MVSDFLTSMYGGQTTILTQLTSYIDMCIKILIPGTYRYVFSPFYDICMYVIALADGMTARRIHIKSYPTETW